MRRYHTGRSEYVFCFATKASVWNPHWINSMREFEISIGKTMGMNSQHARKHCSRKLEWGKSSKGRCSESSCSIVFANYYVGDNSIKPDRGRTFKILRGERIRGESEPDFQIPYQIAKILLFEKSWGKLPFSFLAKKCPEEETSRL